MGRLRISISVLSVIGVFLLQALAPGLSQVSPSFAANGWLPTTPLPKSLANHSTVIYSDMIYVIGGKDASENPVNTVFCSVIGSDGAIGNWAETTPLPANLFAHTAVVSGERVYVTGGWNGANTSKLTYYALFDSNGLGNWEPASARLPTGLDLHSAVAYNGRIYVMGGWDGYQIVKTVYFASIETDGDILNWYPTTDLPQPVYRHSSVVYDGRIYVMGGRTVGNKPLDTVYIATLAGGGVGAWIETTPLPKKLYYQSAFVSNGKIYVMGGYDGSSAIDKVYSASIKADGSLEPWIEVENLRLPKELFRHSAVLAENGGVYLLGGKYNNLHISDVYFIPPLSLTKSNDPSGPVHEGDVITYTISYANTGLATQTGVVITDRIPFNTELVSVSSPPDYEIVANSVISWCTNTLGVGETGVVSFQVRVPLLPSPSQSVDMLSSMEAYPPAQVVPVAIACDTTRFWAIGVTRQPPVPNPHTIQVQIPPGASPSEMWLLMKETDNISPTVEGHPAQRERTSSNSFGASLWTAPITSAMVANGEVTVVTYNPRQLNALFLLNANDPPFDEAALDDFYNTTVTFTYALDIPSVATKTIDVILPFMDITYWKDDLHPDARTTMVTVEFDDQSHTIPANDPNLGNGLLMTEFPFTIGPLSDAITSTKVLTVTVDTEDSIYTLGPRVCRPVYIKNTAWLCSDRVGCVSDTVTNVPEDFQPPGGIYLPIILKSHP